MRQVLGLTGSEYELVKSFAYQLNGSFQHLDRRAGATLRSSTLHANDRQEALASSRAERDRVIHAAVKRTQRHFGAAVFQELDQRFREHIVP